MDNNTQITKEESIGKINKFGKIAAVLTKIAKIIMIVGLCLAVVGTVAVAFLPKELLQVSIEMSGDVGIDLSSFNVNFSKQQQESIKNGIINDNSTFNFDGYVLSQISDIEVDESSFYFTAQGETKTFNLRDVLLVMIVADFYLIVALITAIYINRLATAFRDCESPFEDNVIKKMQKLAISLIPLLVIKAILSAIASGLFTGSFSVSFSGISIISVLVIFGLTYVFKYGAKLQQESDETL